MSSSTTNSNSSFRGAEIKKILVLVAMMMCAPTVGQREVEEDETGPRRARPRVEEGRRVFRIF